MNKNLLRRIAAAALAFAGAAGLFATPVAAQRAQAAPAQRDWTREIAATLEGGFRMGNPAAPTKVVEYVSLSCPHCRQFAETGAPALIRDHVASGRLSFEIRPFPLDPVAEIGAQINRCAAPARAFALNDAILAAQPAWFARIEALTPAETAELNALSAPALRHRVAALLGFDAIAAQHGIDAAALTRCLSDHAGAARVAEIKAAAEALGIGGTPSFLINGAVAGNVHDWTALQPRLGAGR
ncbi:MAG TPA: thioredoxin domain-containing protein [Allosphingosinicella sp.]|jgi:protein-disulfide isomerase